MIDGSCADGGAAVSPIANNFNAGVPATDLRRFVSVDSEFYQQLSSYYEWRIDDWFTANATDGIDRN